ncbi:hypothetical protein RSW84_27185, partial [Escherichia coli]|uniref:hypothetical protein n=1 Tax=Escherichia coli TaxID=562 RepID=UPI0028DDE05B
ISTIHGSLQGRKRSMGRVKRSERKKTFACDCAIDYFCGVEINKISSSTYAQSQKRTYYIYKFGCKLPRFNFAAVCSCYAMR